MSIKPKESVVSPLQACEIALSKYDEARSPENFKALAALLAPSLFKGQGSFFDNVCTHVSQARGGSLIPALLSFMDQLCRAGDLEAPGQPPMSWRSAALLCEIIPDEGQHDPCFFEGLQNLEASVAELFGLDPSLVRVAPLALDLRTVSPSYDFFRFAMLPTQLAGIDMAQLAASNPNQALPAGFTEPPRLWKALMISCAFDSASAPEALAVPLAKAIGEGVNFTCEYAMGDDVHSAVLEISAVMDPFSACSAGFEPERVEMERDFGLLKTKFGSQVGSLLAILEPTLSPSSAAGAGEPLVESISLSICAPDGIILDAIALPGQGESLALANALLSSAGIPARMAPPAVKAVDGNGDRLWASHNGRYPFDIFNWRQRVLGAQDHEQPSRS